MALSVDEKKLMMKQIYENRKRSIIKRKKNLLKQFRNYVLDKIKNTSSPMKIRYCLINGDENLSYEDLNIGDEFIFEFVFFKFNFETEMIVDHRKIKYKVIKQTENMEDLPNESYIYFSTTRKMQQRPTEAPLYEQEQISERIQKKVDSTLSAVFKGQLTFTDPKFQKLAEENYLLEKELQMLEAKIIDLDSNKFDHIFQENNDNRFKLM